MPLISFRWTDQNHLIHLEEKMKSVRIVLLVACVGTLSSLLCKAQALEL